jgi:hypothetical protein
MSNKRGVAHCIVFHFSDYHGKKNQKKHNIYEHCMLKILAQYLNTISKIKLSPYQALEAYRVVGC